MKIKKIRKLFNEFNESVSNKLQPWEKNLFLPGLYARFEQLKKLMENVAPLSEAHSEILKNMQEIKNLFPLEKIQNQAQLDEFVNSLYNITKCIAIPPNFTIDGTPESILRLHWYRDLSQIVESICKSSENRVRNHFELLSRFQTFWIQYTKLSQSRWLFWGSVIALILAFILGIFASEILPFFIKKLNQ